jgi:Domain of unknown function (DUF397)
VTEQDQPSFLLWKKSTASSEDSCVEVATALEIVYVRDSKDPSGHALNFSRPEWKAFLVGVCANH